MEQLWNEIEIIEQAGFPLGTDAVLLAHFAQLPKNAKVADLGSSWGALGLMLCAKDEACQVTGIERNEAAHAAALSNISHNRLEGRLASLLGDAREISTLLPAGSFDCVISNPPYFPVGSGKLSLKNAEARSEEFLDLPQLCAAAAWLLPSGGRFFMVHRPERLCDIFCTLRNVGIEPKRLQFVRHKEGALPGLVLVEGRRGGKPGLSFDPDFIEFTESGVETPQYQAAYHRGEQL